MFVFFFSSRRRHTRCLSDWSSDVCSSDLAKASRAALSGSSASAGAERTARSRVARKRSLSSFMKRRVAGGERVRVGGMGGEFNFLLSGLPASIHALFPRGLQLAHFHLLLPPGDAA